MGNIPSLVLSRYTGSYRYDDYVLWRIDADCVSSFFFFFPLRFTKDLAEMTEGSKVANLIVRIADVCNTISNGMRLTRAANAPKKKKKRKRVRHPTERKFL